MRSTYIRHLLSMLALLLCASAVFAQKNQQGPVAIYRNKLTEIRAGVPVDSVEKMIGIVQRAFDKYLLYNSLRDSATQTVTQRAIGNFTRLFSSNAEVADDITEITENNRQTDEKNYSDYASKVYELFEKEGLTTLITNAYAAEIRFDSAGFYRIVLVVEKRIKNRYNPVSKKADIKGDYRCYRLDNFHYDVPANLKGEAKIFSISGKYVTDCPPIPKTPVVDPKKKPTTPPSPDRPSAPVKTKKLPPPGFGAFIRLGLGNQLSGDPRSFLGDKTKTDIISGLALKTEGTFGGGLSAQFPLGQKGWYLGVTLVGQSTSATASFNLVAYTESNLDDIDKGQPEPDKGAIHDYYVRIKGGKEEIKLTSFELSPGIGKIWQGEGKIGFGAEAQLILRMNSAKGTLSADSALYKGRYKKLDWTTPDTDPKFDPTYGYYKYPVQGDVQYASKFSTGLRFSPTLRIQLGSSETTFLNIGADCDLMFGSVLASNSPEDKHILRAKGKQASSEEGIAYNYLEPVGWGAASFFLRAGVTVALGKKK